MTYNQFLNYVKEQSVYELEHPEDYQASINHIVKNNAVEYDGISLRKHGEELAPMVYLNPFYEQYLDGRPLKSILGEIVSILHDDVPKLEIPASLYDNYDTIRNFIIFQLVNYNRNQELLKDCPYLPFCDLAITFRWLVHADTHGIASSLITNREVELWNVSIQELYQAAKENTQNIFPYFIQPLDDLLQEYLPDEPELQELFDTSSPEFQLYILTNQAKINGATCLIYDGILAAFAKQHHCDIYILPSSIHEVLLLPASPHIEEPALLSLVRDANRTIVADTDFLSDSIYRYDAARNRIIMIQNDLDETDSSSQF